MATQSSVVFRTLRFLMVTHLSNHINNPSIRFRVPKKPRYRAQHYISSTTTDRVITIFVISVSDGGHLGFAKMPPDEILHTLRK